MAGEPQAHLGPVDSLRKFRWEMEKEEIGDGTKINYGE
jgi:hypothetical protein